MLKNRISFECSQREEKGRRLKEDCVEAIRV